VTPHFADRAAERRWRRYFARVDRLAGLAGPAASDIRRELESHLAESLALTVGDNELARLEIAISKLGDPDDYLRPLVADGLIERATAQLDPIGVAHGLYHAIRLGSTRMAIGLIFALGYLVLIVFLAIALLRPLWGGHVGLYRWPNGVIQFGFLKSTSGATDLLGQFTIPAVLAVFGLIYLLLTRWLGHVWRRL